MASKHRKLSLFRQETTALHEFSALKINKKELAEANVNLLIKGTFRLDAKQPNFDVIDSSRKVATGRNLREQLRNIACLQAVVR